MQKFIKWHKKLTMKKMKRFGLDWYSISWISWIKGILTTILIYGLFME